MKRGHLPEWEAGAQAVPQIAKDYWRLPADSTMLDLILAVRADEATHRYVSRPSLSVARPDATSSQLLEPHSRQPRGGFRHEPVRPEASECGGSRERSWLYAGAVTRVGGEGQARYARAQG